jgi:Ras-related protein Rab-21
MLGQDITLVIAGNKIDLERNRVVQLAEAERYAASVGAVHFSIRYWSGHRSAKLNKGLNELFLELTKRMLEAAPKDAVSPGGPPRKKGLVIQAEPAKKPEKEVSIISKTLLSTLQSSLPRDPSTRPFHVFFVASLM